MKKVLSCLTLISIVVLCFFSCDDNAKKITPYEPVVIPVEGLSLDIASKADLPKGSSFTITATVSPTSATNKTVKWTSSNTNIATVDKTGKVTGINSGTTYIIATTADGGFSKSCYVKVLDRFTVTFDSKGGSSVASQIVDDGYKATTPTNPTKQDYGCAGWTTDSNAFTTSADFDFNTPITTDTTLYAKWDKNVFNITYKDKNNENFSGTHASIYPVKHYYGTPTTLDYPTRTGYAFGGWSTETNCTTTITSLGATDYNTDITLYALWNANTYTVTFDVNEGDSTSPTSKTVTYGSAYGTLATATRTNYTFDGWYDEASGGNKITSATTVTKANNHTLYADWIENGKYAVVFNSNGATSGTVPTSITNYIDNSFTVPDNTGNLVKTGYTFSGWNTAQDGSGTDYTTGTNVTPTDSGTITLYAKWIEEPFITFCGNGKFNVFLADNNKEWDGTVEYSTDKTTWTEFEPTTNVASQSSSNGLYYVYLRGKDNNCFSTWNGSCFQINGSGDASSATGVSVSGNIMTLLNYDNPPTTLSDQCFQYLFYVDSDSILTDASELKLPATTLAVGCYDSMFCGCASLKTAPTLPAETLADYCYNCMFQNCTSLKTVPELPAETLADYCYYEMFKECTSIKTVPELPAETLADYCYGYMFNGCTSLESLPENLLPSTSLTNCCYQGMFINCTSLTSIPKLPATELADMCYVGMFMECSALKVSKGEPSSYSSKGLIFTCPSTSSDSAFRMFYLTGGDFSSESTTASETYYWYKE